MKKLIIVTLITTCVALCAAVWPTRKRPLRKLRNPQHWQRRKKERFRDKKRPEKSNLNRR